MTEDKTPHETAESPEDELKEEARELLEKVKAREDTFRDTWWKLAEESEKVYCIEKPPGTGESLQNATVYNILYSNTAVLQPSLYSSTPKPDTRSRFVGKDIGQLSSLTNRFLTVFADPANPAIESFDASITSAVLGGLVTAMGYARLRHYPDRPFPLAIESGHYKSLIWGKARKWSKVPWVAFRHELTKDELFSLFKVSEEDEQKYQPPEENAKGEKSYGTCVYEVWVKEERKIYFICEDWEPILIEEAEDTMELEGFFPLPGFLDFTLQPGKLEPVTLFAYYRNQATELDRVSTRLNKVLSAIRVRGVYHNLLGEELKQMLNTDDKENALVPAADAGFLAQMGGLDKAIWLLPIEKLIIVAQELYKAREAIKQVIYELTGISDIIRGSSVASETATAQGLKNKWGTVRLRSMQIATANYCRDFFRLAIDAATSVCSEEQWKQITQIDAPMDADKLSAQHQIAQMQQEMQMMLAQMPPGSPPPSPPPQMQQLQQIAQTPSVKELVDQLRKDANRSFTINVQTSSTLDLDTASDKSEVTEFMNSMGQMLAGLQLLGVFGPAGLEAMKEMLIAVCQRYKFGLQVVDKIRELKAPPPPTPQEDPTVKAEQAAKMESLQATKQLEQARVAAEMQKLQQQQQLEAAQHNAAMEKIAAEAEILQLKVAAARLRAQSATATIPAGKS